MEFVNCNLCNNNDTTLVYRIDDVDIVRCQKCGLIYQNPRREKEGLKDIYSQEYYDQFIAYFGKDKLLNHACTLIQKLAKYVPSKARVLEIGAGASYTLMVAKERGWEVFGTEISPFAVRYAREKLGLEIFLGGLEEAKFPEGFFDLVIMTHVLEHVTEPSKYLDVVFRLLRNSGILYIAVPNITSFQAWRQKEKWSYLHPGMHIYHFCPNTLRRLVLKAGFSVVRINTTQKIITAEGLSQTGIRPISALGGKLKRAKRHFPFLLDCVRDLIGKFLPGEGIALIAKK